MVDLSSFADLTKIQDDGIDVEILHPKTGESLDITIRVAGPDSARQRNARARVYNAQARSGRNKQQTAEEIEASWIRIVAASIISWSGVVENGQAIDYSTDAAADLLTRYPFILEQINAVVGDRAGFIKT